MYVNEYSAFYFYVNFYLVYNTIKKLARLHKAYEADNLRVCRDEEGDEHRRDREKHAESRDQRVGGTPNGPHVAQTLGNKRTARHAEHPTEARHHSEHQRNTSNAAGSEF